MVVEVGLTWIASEVRLTSFDQSIADIWWEELLKVSKRHNNSVGSSRLRWFEAFLMFPEWSSSNQKENSEGWISSSFGVRGSGEGPTNEYGDVKDESSDTCVEKLSWLNVDSSRQGSLWSVGKKEFSKKLPKISLYSVGFTHANHPPAATPSSRADSMSKPE